MASTEEPILPRLDRLDTILRHLEGIRMINNRSSSAKSSYASTPSSGALTSDGTDFSPKSLEKHCRPIDVVIMETEAKGSLIDRLVQVENRVLELCLQMEEEVEAEKKRVEVVESRNPNQKKKRKGLKHLVKSCVGANPTAAD